jgi:hypothetical protein
LVQKIPFHAEDEKQAGKPYKESASRMEKLPSQLVIHKHTDGTDTKWATYRHAFAQAPLEQLLGAIDFGRYRQVEDSNGAYEPIAELWSSYDVDEKPSVTETPTTETPAPTDPAPAPTVTMEIPAPMAAEKQDPPIADSSNKHKVSLRHLLNQIKSNHDKMAFIWHQHPGSVIKRWYLVKILWSDHQEDDFLRTGMVPVRFYVRHFDDSKRSYVEQCRYWPEIHEKKRNGDMGKLVLCKPAKVQKLLQKVDRYEAYDLEINLQDRYLVGPFNFAHPKEMNNVHHRVYAKHWDALKVSSICEEVDISNLGQIQPLS